MVRHAVTLEDLRQARSRIRQSVVCTPTVETPAIGSAIGLSVAFKCENLQHVGAFKARGACNAVFALDEELAARGVVAHSSGNHAAALARAARLRGIPARIVMPHNSATVKIAAVRALGVEPTFCEPTTEAREAAADEVIEQTRATLIHPFDNRHVIAGQGTAALEILEQYPNVETLVIPVGGGGLLAGSLVAVKALRPEVRVIAAEPDLADDAFRSWQTGSIEKPTRYDTIADGLRTGVGELTFPIIHDLVDEVLTTTEENIVAATRLLFHAGRLVSEPSGAVPLAVMLQHRERFRDQKTVGVISGGNLDVSGFALVGESA